MTIFQKLRVKDATNDAASDIANSLKWNYEYLLDYRRTGEKEIDENLGEVTEDIENRLMTTDARIKVYEKVFEILEKM